MFGNGFNDQIRLAVLKVLDDLRNESEIEEESENES